MVAEFDDDHPPIKHRVFEGDEYDAGEGISVGLLSFLYHNLTFVERWRGEESWRYSYFRWDLWKHQA